MTETELLFMDIKPSFSMEHKKNIDYLVNGYVNDFSDAYKKVEKDSFENSLEDVLNNESIKSTVDDAYNYLKKNTEPHLFPKEGEEMIKFGILASLVYHDKQHRKTGGYYFKHPFELAIDLAKLGEDYITITAALLHDTIEEKLESEKESGNDVTREELIRELERTLNKFYSICKTDLFENSAFDYYQTLRMFHSHKSGKDLDKVLNDEEKQKFHSLIKKQTKELPIRLIRRLSRSDRSDYKRYKSNIFSEPVIRKEIIDFLKTIKKKLPGIEDNYREFYNADIIPRTAQIKLSDMDNNLETLSVINIELEELIESGVIKDNIITRSGVMLQNRKKQFLDYLERQYKVEAEQRERKKYSLNANVKRNLAHALGEKHLLTGFGTTKNIFHALFRYNSIISEKRFKYYAKSWWLRNETAKYLDRIDIRSNPYHLGILKDKLDYSHSVALEAKSQHCDHMEEYHLQPWEIKKWEDLVGLRYIPERKHIKISEPFEGEIIPYDGMNISETNEHLRLEGIAHHLSTKVLKKEEMGEGRKIKISKELREDRGFQHGILLAMCEIDREYLKSRGFYFGKELFD
ncbi:hypothetical protein HQ529_05040 [Candidatus Woesearchaeota archaeon]|nr:hypothetical protein [Candidatus Woesearchaeota archaeon]